MWATEKQERTWVSVGKKAYSSISNSNYCIYPLPSNYIVHKYLAKSQKYDTYCNYNSLLFLSFDELHEMVMEELNLGSTLNLRE